MTDIILNNADLQMIMEWIEHLGANVREKTILQLEDGIRLFYINTNERISNTANNDKKVMNQSGEDDYRPNFQDTLKMFQRKRESKPHVAEDGFTETAKGEGRSRRE
jgi:hypothetical protein